MADGASEPGWVDVPFTSHGTTCAARVFRPAGSASVSSPVIVMAHGFGAVRALGLDAYAQRFAAAGYVVVAFDYRGFGDSDGHPRQLLDIGMQHEDWRAALAFARGLDGVEPDRVVAWGTSFAGGHVMTLAGAGEPLAAIIAQVPHVSGPAAVRATGLRRSLRLAPAAIRDQVGSWLGRDPVLVDCVGKPGQTAVMTSPDAEVGMTKLLEASGLRRGDRPENVAARIVLKIGLYSPGRSAARIACPALVQIVRQDAVTPCRVAEKAAHRMPHSQVLVYDGGHFDPYVEPLFTQVIADQLSFLAAQVPVQRS